jgi:nucleotide-binding universal stress UspA family protein
MIAASSWKSIVVGMDASPEAAEAAAFGCRLARAAGTTCHLAHAIPEPWIATASGPLPRDLVALRQVLADRAARELARPEVVPPGADQVIVRLGRPVRVLQEIVAECGAEVVVLGGKRHPALERWLGGSTALNAVRALAVPVLVTRHPPGRPRRVLVAADMSAAAAPTLAAAERLAHVFGADLRAVSVLEPIPAAVNGGSVLSSDYFALWEEMLKRDLWPLLRDPGTETVVRHGPVVRTIEEEVGGWGADLLVVGSHGKGWVDRALIGSVTERLLNHLPTSLLVVPVAPVAASHGGREGVGVA